MKEVLVPVFSAPSVVAKGRTTFFRFDKEVVVEAPGTLIAGLIRLCDGQRSLEDVIAVLKDKWDESSLRELASDLVSSGVLVDSRNFAGAVWSLVENPQRFPTLRSDEDVERMVALARTRDEGNRPTISLNVSSSPLSDLLNSRRSTRSFSARDISPQDLSDILWSGYGKTDGTGYHRTVPSAGALYPLAFHVALLREVGGIGNGVYEISASSPKTVGLELVRSDLNKLARAFVDPLVLEAAAGVVIISGSFGITGEKYGNRSALFVPLEAGHAAQNIHLAASEKGLATVEIGGFLEGSLSEAIGLHDDYRPLTAILFGYEGNAEEKQKIGVTVLWGNPVADSYRVPFAIAIARVSPERSWSYGRAFSPPLAATKAVSEAKEWGACGYKPSSLIKAKVSDISDAIDPREIVRFHPAQYRLKNFPFAPFSVESEYEWVTGRDEMSGRDCRVIADLVYFPTARTRMPYAYANSSGAAANPDRNAAAVTSVLELVERDSFMTTYLARLSSPAVALETLPEEIGKRVSDLEKAGFRIWIKDISLGLAPVVFVYAQNEEIFYTTCAACSSFDLEHAVSHPLMEVEGSVLARLQNGPPDDKSPRNVWVPSDHGALYEQKRFFRRADFLTLGRDVVPFGRIGRNSASSWRELMDIFSVKGWKLITIPLQLPESLGGNGDLHIVRSIVPGMVPMTFGYRQEPAGMERLYEVAGKFGKPSFSYKDITKFPHPFA